VGGGGGGGGGGLTTKPPEDKNSWNAQIRRVAMGSKNSKNSVLNLFIQKIRKSPPRKISGYAPESDE